MASLNAMMCAIFLVLAARPKQAGSFVPTSLKQMGKWGDCSLAYESTVFQREKHHSSNFLRDGHICHVVANEGSDNELSRRSCLALLSGCVVMNKSREARADDAVYENPNIPPGPEERSGLVVLRVAEVANFQEKILRAVANGDLDFAVSPQQIAFGTQILLRNSNLDGNMKLMIYNEVPRKRREEAIKNAAKSMNGLQTILSEATNTQRPFENDDLLHFADMYRDVRLQLNNMYECLPPKEKSKYYGYFMAVTEYEKKIAEGTYNPDVDGILKLEYD